MGALGADGGGRSARTLSGRRRQRSRRSAEIVQTTPRPAPSASPGPPTPSSTAGTARKDPPAHRGRAPSVPTARRAGPDIRPRARRRSRDARARRIRGGGAEDKDCRRGKRRKKIHHHRPPTLPRGLSRTPSPDFHDQQQPCFLALTDCRCRNSTTRTNTTRDRRASDPAACTAGSTPVYTFGQYFFTIAGIDQCSGMKPRVWALPGVHYCVLFHAQFKQLNERRRPCPVPPQEAKEPRRQRKEGSPFQCPRSTNSHTIHV
mmetsp:Transcript_48890/g.103954  ORF Transcript_48890/g.103954 Transcript_48890/m.103954 type:complete len:261 (-) Transcript_48890:299-1081(-)